MDGQFVTILFTDLVGSTELYGRLGDEAADTLRREHFTALRSAVAEHGGREVKSTGDGLMVAFGSAVAAVRCAVAMQALTGSGLQLRVGLDAGEPLPDGDDLYGTPVIVASRLCDTAEAGEILASEVVCSVVRSRIDVGIENVGALRLRGVADRVTAGRIGAPREEPAPAAGPKIRVMIADDQRLVRSGFRVILEDEPDLQVVAEAADGRSAVDLALRTRPDVILMDIRMPELNGLKAAERILSEPGIETAVLMLTTFDLDEYVYEALRVGASGFLLKDAQSEQLIDAVRVAAAGDALLAPSITRRLIGRFADAARPAAGVPAAVSELTPRELEVLRLVARGLSNAEIAESLTLGDNTVKTHVARMLGKLNLRDRVQAVVFAYENGLVAAGAGD